MTETNVFALAQIIKAAGSDPSMVTEAVWNAGYCKPARDSGEAVALTLDIIAGFEGDNLPWEVWPKTYDDILQCELNDYIAEELWHNKLSALEIAGVLIREGYTRAMRHD